MKALRSIAVLLALAVLALSPPMAHAIATLEISDGVTTLTVVDNGAGDTNPLVGAVLVSGFAGLVVNTDTGLSKPVLPFPGAIDLNAVLVTGTAKDITLKFSDDFFTIPTSGQFLTTHMGGTLTSGIGSTITFDGYQNNSNGIFDIVGAAHVGPLAFGNGAFAGSGAAFTTAVAPYSLTEIVTVHFTGAGTTSFNVEVRLVPVPGTLILIGVGLIGLGARAWRQRKQDVRK